MAALAVTGSTGRLGGRVARRISDARVEQRLLVRDRTRAPQLDAASVAVASYSDAVAAEKALQGVDTLFMVSGAESLDRVAQHRTLVDAAVAAGVRHLVYTSFYGAAPTSTFTLARDHFATEQYIKGSGLDFTFLRDNIYADFFELMVGDDGVIRGPAGDGHVSAVAQDDIADVAAAVLLNPGEHAGAAYDLTGPEALTMARVAQTLSAVTGQKVSYHDETLDEAYESRARYGAPRWQVDAWVSTYTAIAAGELAGVSTAVEELSGHRTTSFEELLRRRS